MRRLKISLLLAALGAALLVAGASAFGVIDEPLPTGVVGQPYSYQFKVSGGNPPYEFTVKSGEFPPGLSLSLSGLVSGSPTQVGEFHFYIEGSYQFDSSPRKYSQRQFTLNVIQGLAIQQTSLPALVQGAPYSVQLTATGGGTQTWSVLNGTLPTGLGLSSGGVISGTPTAVGTFAFTVRVSDGSRTDDQAYSVDVIEALKVSAQEIPPAVVGSQFTLPLTATGGRAPYTWAVTEGSWPRGLTLLNGQISGAPRAAGTYAFTVAATDALGNTAPLPLTLFVNPRLKIPLQVLKLGRVGIAYRAKIVTKGGAAPLTFELADGDLPRGVRLNVKTGALVGKPRVKGRYAFGVAVADQLGNTHARSFVLRIR